MPEIKLYLKKHIACSSEFWSRKHSINGVPLSLARILLALSHHGRFHGRSICENKSSHGKIKAEWLIFWNSSLLWKLTSAPRVSLNAFWRGVAPLMTQPHPIGSHLLGGLVLGVTTFGMKSLNTWLTNHI